MTCPIRRQPITMRLWLFDEGGTREFVADIEPTVELGSPELKAAVIEQITEPDGAQLSSADFDLGLVLVRRKEGI